MSLSVRSSLGVKPVWVNSSTASSGVSTENLAEYLLQP